MTIKFEVSDAQYAKIEGLLTEEQKARPLTPDEEKDVWARLREIVGPDRIDEAMAQEAEGKEVEIVRVKAIKKKRKLKMPANRPDLPSG